MVLGSPMREQGGQQEMVWASAHQERERGSTPVPYAVLKGTENSPKFSQAMRCANIIERNTSQLVIFKMSIKPFS